MIFGLEGGGTAGVWAGQSVEVGEILSKAADGVVFERAHRVDGHAHELGDFAHAFS